MVLGPSVHSRAARRATSPSIDTDKSLKDVKLPEVSSHYRPDVFGVQQGSGITKRARKGRKAVLSTKARKRQEKQLDRAEAVMDRTAKKIERSRGQMKNINTRKKNWDDVNKQIPGKPTKGAEKLDQDEHERAAVAWETDEEMDGADESTLSAPAAVPVVDAAQVPLPAAESYEDEIL